MESGEKPHKNRGKKIHESTRRKLSSRDLTKVSKDERYNVAASLQTMYFGLKMPTPRRGTSTQSERALTDKADEAG